MQYYSAACITHLSVHKPLTPHVHTDSDSQIQPLYTSPNLKPTCLIAQHGLTGEKRAGGGDRHSAPFANLLPARAQPPLPGPVWRPPRTAATRGGQTAPPIACWRRPRLRRAAPAPPQVRQTMLAAIHTCR